MMLTFSPKETNFAKTCREKERNFEHHLKLQYKHPLFFLNCVRTKWLKKKEKPNKIAALRIHKPIQANKKLDNSHAADNHSN